MFLLELYLQNRKAKVEAWRKRGEEWLVDHPNYYSFEDYERKYPKPVFPWKTFFGALPIVLVAITVITTVVVHIATAPPPKVDPNNPHGCEQVVKKGDRVAVTYGDFVGSEGVVIQQGNGLPDDCGANIKLTKSTNTRDECAKVHNDCRRERNVGEELYVDSSGNFTKTN